MPSMPRFPARPTLSAQATLAQPSTALPSGESAPRPWATVYADAAALIGRAMLAGLICGALIAGVGGRLAMLLLRLTSPEHRLGLRSDDGFIIGEFTFATVNLISFMAAAGAISALPYLAVRSWLPARLRPLILALLGATVIGQSVIHPDGVDFTLLEPVWLAVALFILLPALYGAALPLLTERFLRPGGWQQHRRRWLLALPLLLLLANGLAGLAIIALIALIIAADRDGHIARLWRFSPLLWAGRSAILLLVAVSSVQLARDLAAVL